MKYIIPIIIACITSVSVYLGITLPKEPTSGVLLTEDQKSRINKSIAGIPNIYGIMLLQVNMQNNTRRLVYRYETNKDLKQMYDQYYQVRSVDSTEPLFVRNNDKLNLRLVRIINREFDCSPYSEAIAARFVPDSIPIVSTICAVSIPPAYGAFDGIVSVFLNTPPTPDEEDVIQIILKRIANDVASEFAKK